MDLDLLVASSERVIAGVTQKSVANYLRIMRRYGEGGVADDADFQRFYAYFYRMTRRGLTADFKRRYFELLDTYRGAEVIDVESIVGELYAIPNSSGRRTLQFSFATKLAHTAAPTYPIYDALVARVFGFKPTYYGEFENRLARLSDFYSMLEATYSRWRSDSRMQGLIREFHSAYDTSAAEVSDTKVMDFLMWSAGRLPELCS